MIHTQFIVVDTKKGLLNALACAIDAVESDGSCYLPTEIMLRRRTGKSYFHIYPGVKQGKIRAAKRKIRGMKATDLLA